MKDIEVERIVHDCTAQLFFDAIYDSDVGMRTFHAKVNGDPAAVVGRWSDAGRRTVQFVMPMNVPAMLRKFIGMDSVPVVETQQLEWLIPGKAFKVVSEPQLNFPGANKFTTSGFLEVRSLPDGTCQVRALVWCSAALPWPVQATVEGLMATEAIQSIGTFLTFCQQFYCTWRAEQLLLPERPAADANGSAAAAGIGGVAGVGGGDVFFDAVEDESDLRSARGGEEEEGEASVVPYQPPRLEDIIVDCLRQIQSSSAETARTLRNLEELLRNMDENMQVVRDKLVGRRPHNRTQQGAGGAEGGGQAAGCDTATNTVRPAAGGLSAACSSSSSSSYIGFLATASLLCGAGAFVYVRYRLGTGGGGK